MRRLLIFISFITAILSLFSQEQSSEKNRWQTVSVGKIEWSNDGHLPHFDNIEMAGLKISAIINYGINSDSSFFVSRKMVLPMLRTIPNDTRGSLIRSFNLDYLKTINIDGKKFDNEKVKKITLNGLLNVHSTYNKNIEINRMLFPSSTKASFCELYSIKNNSDKTINIELPLCNIEYTTDAEKGVDGSYILNVFSSKNGVFNVAPGNSIEFGLIISGRKSNESKFSVELDDELNARKELVAEWLDYLVLETPNPTLNNAFAFAKIRASESIFDTKGGLFHSPGGGEYYAAIWANDQAEYVAPFFPFLGYEIANKASMNAYLHFARYMNDEYKSIPSSIIAEGLDFWNGAGDRGDQAMIAYGAARFALSLGDKAKAETLWSLIEWCLEYLKRNIDQNGVVKSDSDELENRFPSGDANLSTSSLYYDALLSAAYLGKELNKPTNQIKDFLKRAEKLKQAIENHFGYTVQGFDTYRYYEGNEVLRAWICMPLTVGIFDRKEGTIDALFSPKLWTQDGLSTQAGSKTFWDRATLYALKGVFATGEKEKALNFLEYYSNRRLLGEHVPYPVEAYPEGNQRHLSAESGLYCRIFTEGLFGIRPTGLKSFELTPQLPNEWDYMTLKKIRAFDEVFDISIKRKNKKIEIHIVSGDKVVLKKYSNIGETIKVKL